MPLNNYKYLVLSSIFSVKQILRLSSFLLVLLSLLFVATPTFAYPYPGSGSITVSNVSWNPNTSNLSFDVGTVNPDAPIQGVFLFVTDSTNMNDVELQKNDDVNNLGNIYCLREHFCSVNLTYSLNAYNGFPHAYILINSGGQYFSSQILNYADITTTSSANHPPVINQIPSATINQGDTYSHTVSFTDPDSTSWTGEVDYGDGSGVQQLSVNPDNTFSLSHLYSDHGIYTVTLGIRDNQGAVGYAQLAVSVDGGSPQYPYPGSGSFTASNVSWNPNTSNLSFDVAPGSWDGGLQGVFLYVTDSANFNTLEIQKNDAITSPTEAGCLNNGHCTINLQYFLNAYNGFPHAYILINSSGYLSSQILNYADILSSANQPPAINTFPGGTINEGSTYSANGSFTDPSSTSWTATVDYGDGSGTQPLSLSGTNFTLNHTYTTAGQFTVTVNVTDNQGATGTGSATVTVNAPPHINSFSGGTINEGGTYTSNGSFTDPDSTSWTGTVDYGDSSGSHSLTLSGMNFSLSHVYKDNGTYTVTVSVTDNQGATGTGTATVTVNNVAPTPGAITAPSSPVLVNTAITASANFTDPGVLDTHTASWNWGDGNTTTGTVTESNGSGSVSNTHAYTATGVYMITLTVTDKDGGVGTSTFPYVSVYDSNSSFAGGRSFDNPTNASPSTSGKVSFGISAKYNNSNVLTGSAKIDFKAANLDFASNSPLTSLATTNGRAYLKGTGTLNGSGTYTFLATGIDGSVAGGNDLIRFQIKDSSGNVVYDSQPGAGDTTDPTTPDATGNIRVH